MPHFQRLSITPEFRAAVRADERGIVQLAHLLGVNSYTSLSKLLTTRTFAGTPQNRRRLTDLAQLIGFSGEVTRG